MTFEASEESLHMLERTGGEGDNFKVLGVNFDCQLRMEDAVHEVVIEARWRLKTLLRTSRYYTGRQLVELLQCTLALVP